MGEKIQHIRIGVVVVYDAYMSSHPLHIRVFRFPTNYSTYFTTALIFMFTESKYSIFFIQDRKLKYAAYIDVYL